MQGIENIVQQLARMQWSDYLDIAVVAFLIYRLLPLIKTPSTVRVARVVVAAIIVAALTDALDLYTLNYILNQFLTIGILALIVLFQPELRRMLDHLGNVKFKTLFSSTKPVEEMAAVIDQTVTACTIMSRDRVGALIVFAREARLDDIIRTGTTVDGLVSEQLIRNIFFTNASLHDGAMVIRDGRITAAGCVLPLADGEWLNADLGTRHRAGVGMSQTSDAVVVIVSEEKGTISVAVDGMLKSHLAPQTLTKLLRKELNVEKPDEEDAGLTVRLKKKIAKAKETKNRENEK